MQMRRIWRELRLAQLRTWLIQLVDELVKSPLAQLSFFLAIVGTALALLSSWVLIVGWISTHWSTLTVSLVIAFAIVSGASLFSREVRNRRMRASQEQLVDQAATYIVEILSGGVTLTRTQAIKLLNERFGASGDNLLGSLLSRGSVKMGFGDKLELSR